MNNYTYYRVVETGKIGCTIDLEARKSFKLYSKKSYNELGLTLEEIETREFNNNHTASIYEQILQIKNGAKLDSFLYKTSRENLKKGPYISGRNNVLSGHLASIQSKGGKIAGKINGKTMKGKLWFNNGIISTRSIECPEGFVKGSLHKNSKHWYNNGVISKLSKECPEGFVKGRLCTKI